MNKLPKRINVANFITAKVNESAKTQREIAAEAGFENPNIITMFKTGATRVPLDRVGPLAKALAVDPAYLLRIVMLEYAPDTWEEVENNLQSVVLTANEVEVIRAYRRISGDTDAKARVIEQELILSIGCA